MAENDDNVAPEVIGAACPFDGCGHVFEDKVEGRAHLKRRHGGMFRFIPAFVLVALSAVLCGACGGLFRKQLDGSPWPHRCQLPGAALFAGQPLGGANAAAGGHLGCQPAAGQAPALPVGLPREQATQRCVPSVRHGAAMACSPTGPRLCPRVCR